MMSFKVDDKFQSPKYIVNVNHIKQTLNSTKDKLDDIYKNYNYANKVMKLFDPFRVEKYKIAKRINASNVTIAWLKGYEIINTFKLTDVYNNHHIKDITKETNTSLKETNTSLKETNTSLKETDEEKEFLPNKFIYFDNASFPGSFILAMNHYMQTTDVNNGNYKKNIGYFKWYAASLLTNTHENHSPLEDSYALYKNYPNNWLMNSHNNGDISCIENIKDFQLQMEQKEGDSHSVHLYTCDLGMDVSNDYNNQELLHSHLNICQIFCGLAVLKQGGNLVVKHYTLFEPFTIKYLTILSQLFEKMYITKPLSSKRTNSEVYIVCKGYKYPLIGNNQIIYDLFMNCVATKNIETITEFEICELFDSYQSFENITQCIFHACSSIFTKQSISLNQYIYHIKNPKLNYKCKKIVFNNNNKIIKQFYKMDLLRIKHPFNLQTINKYYKDKKQYIV
jgi:23S rRNA U2552 (ribose-2'-O)-methylase RlmE/FtsJ